MARANKSLPLTEEDHAQRLAVYALGLSDSASGKMVGVGECAFRMWRKARGLPANIGQCTISKARSEERERLIRLGWTDVQIAFHQGVHEKSIYQFRKARGLQAGPGTIEVSPMFSSMDRLHNVIADQSWSNWLEEMGATTW